MSRLHLQQLDLDWMTPGKSYVAISVAMGKQHQPHRVTKRLIQDFKENSTLCALLDKLDIMYDVMPCRVDSFAGGATFSVEAEEKEPEMKYLGERERRDDTDVASKSASNIKLEGNPFSETLDGQQEKEPEPQYDAKEVGCRPTNPEADYKRGRSFMGVDAKRRTIGNPKSLFPGRELTKSENSINATLFKKLIADID